MKEQEGAVPGEKLGGGSQCLSVADSLEAAVSSSPWRGCALPCRLPD